MKQAALQPPVCLRGSYGNFGAKRACKIKVGEENAALLNRADRIHLESAYGLYENQPWL